MTQVKFKSINKSEDTFNYLESELQNPIKFLNPIK